MRSGGAAACRFLALAACKSGLTVMQRELMHWGVVAARDTSALREAFWLLK